MDESAHRNHDTDNHSRGDSESGRPESGPLVTATPPAPAPSPDLLHAMARDVRNSELDRIAQTSSPKLESVRLRGLQFRDAERLQDLHESLLREMTAEEVEIRTSQPTVPAPAYESDGWSRLRESERPGAEVPTSESPIPDAGLSTVRPEESTSHDRRSSVTSSGAVPRDALDLVTRRSRPPSSPGLSLAREMEEREALGDYSGALRVALLVLGRNAHHRDAQRCAEACRNKLIQLNLSRLSSLAGVSASGVGDAILELSVPEREVRWLGLDHRQGFVLSRVDGMTALDDLVDLCAMPRLEVLQTLVELVDAGVVCIRPA